MKTQNIRLGAYVLLAAAVLGAASLLPAQTSTTGTIFGTITDSTGGVVPGATVTILEISTNQSRETKSNVAGHYQFVSMLPGKYRLTVSMSGFRQAIVQDVVLEVAKSAQVDVRLEVGGVTQTVEVQAAGVAELQTLDSTVGAVMKGDMLLRLATGNRSAAELLSLQPMVVPSRGVGVTQGGQVAGARSDQNQFNLDGIDATDLTSGTAGYFNSAIDAAGPTPSVPVPLESVEEFRVSTTNPNATFGRSAGGQVSFVTRRGSNTLHGTAYWYHQNDNLNANFWTSNRLGIKRPEKKDNRFGLSLGGPIFKDRTFIFGHYEGRRLPRANLVTHVLVPSAELRAGILRFPDAAGNVIPYNIRDLDPRGRGPSPVVTALWNRMPQGNDITRGDGLNTIGFTGLGDATQRMDFGVVRVDHNLNDNWRVNASYRYATQAVADTTQVDVAGLTGGTPGEIRVPGVIPVEPRFFSVQLSGTISPTMINELNLGYKRGFWSYRRLRAFPQVPGTAAAILPGFDVAGLHAGIDIDTQRGRSRTWRDQTYQIGDNFTWIKGKHTLQTGYSYYRMPVFHERDDKVIGSLTSLIYEVNAFNNATISSIPANIRAADRNRFASLLASSLGMVDKAGVVLVRDPDLNNLPLGTPMRIYATFTTHEMYFQDVWRITPSLTLTAGMTYSVQTPPVDKNGLQTLMIDAATGQNIEIDSFYRRRIEAANAGQVYNP
ncbi:MAG: carboxypeptidase regulatory-like domain-containing protein, partial [Longimicrobiales bacterium]